MRITKKITAYILATSLLLSGITFYNNDQSEVKAAVGDWKEVWSDEFNGTSLDTNTWTYEIGNGNWGWGNGEAEYYTDRPENISVSDGYLKITAKKENYKNFKYTSGRIISRGKKNFKYGKMEARIKVENGKYPLLQLPVTVRYSALCLWASLLWEAVCSPPAGCDRRRRRL